MKKIAPKAALAALAIFLTFAGSAHAADKLAPTTIAVVDVQKILQDSTAAQGIRQQLDDKRTAFQNEIKKEEDRLRAANDDIVKNHDTMTKDQLADKQKTLRQDFATVERKVMARRHALDLGFADAMKQVRAALAEIVVNEAHAQGANVVLPKEGTMWIEASLEITDTVLKQLNTKLPKVTVKVPAPQDK